MKIKPKLLSCIVLGAGLLGSILCLFAQRLGTDERGLLPSYHPVHILVYLLSIGILVFLVYVLKDVKGTLPYGKTFPTDVLSLAGYGLAALGLGYTAFDVYLSSTSPLAYLAGFSGLVAAGCMGAIGYLRYKKQRPHYIFHAIVTVHLTLLLVYRYQEWNTEPQLFVYFTQLMASLLLMLTFYQRTALDAGSGSRRDFAFFGLAAVFFCCLAAINSFTVLYLTLAAWCMTNQCSLKRVREIPHMKLPEEVMYCIETLSGAGYSVYAVGGCVRDHLMGLTPSDFDLCTSATPEQICELFERHQLVHSGEKHGTIGVVVAGELYEITTFRTEGEYSDTRHPDWVEFVTDVRQDLARRDFTVNAIAYNPQIGFVDPFGGMQDLEKKILRAVGEPEKRFREDALRILRGVRFSVRFALTPEEKTLAAMNSCAPLMENLARERVCTEVCKLLPLINADQLLRYQTILTQVFPELTPEEGEDLYPQVAAVAGQLPAVLELRMAALLHRLDEETVTRILTDLRVSNALRNRVTLLVQLQTPALPADKKQLLPLLGEHGQEAIEQLAALQLAIAKQAQAATADLALVQLTLQAIRQDGSCLTVKDLSIKGSDLLELGVQPGPRIGQCMQFLLSLVQDEIIANEKEVLLESAKDFLATEEE